MTIKQFEYKPLSHYSYAIVSDGKMAVIDPERNPQLYLEYAKSQNATIVAVFETHPHADFVSSHLELHKTTKATIYNSEKLGAEYPHKSFDEGDHFNLGTISLRAINTPGHSPDSITIVATENGNTVLFTGDTLFIGDVGRPDLRETSGKMMSKREALAAMMYTTVTTKFNDLPDDAIIYPAHGAGSLCGKSMGDAASSTLGEERQSNWAFKKQSQEAFVETLLEGQPFIPAYFGYNVDINKEGADNLEPSLTDIPYSESATAKGLIIDMRNEASFKKGHLVGSYNIQAASDTAKFETWLGAIVKPKETFTLVIDQKENTTKILERIAKIGYENQVKQVITLSSDNLEKSQILDLADFRKNPDNYTIVDVRNNNEVSEGKFFKNALAHPLHDLRTTASDIPTQKPIVVHCAGGYRSAAGSSILESELKNATIYDLSDAVDEFKN